MRCPRVNGNLNLSRAIGDLKYKGNDTLSAKDQIITAQPDIIQAGSWGWWWRMCSCLRTQAGCAACVRADHGGGFLRCRP